MNIALTHSTIEFGFITSLLMFWGGLGTAVWFWLHPPATRNLNNEEKRIQEIRRQTEREEARRRKEIRRVAMDLRKRVIANLAMQGHTYIYERQGAIAKAAKPEIRTILYTSEAIYFRIDKLPFKVQYTDLTKPETTQNLQLAIGRECRFIPDQELGLWLQIGLKSGIAAIPRHFAWHSESTAQNAVELLPETKRHVVAMGMTENRVFVSQDFRDFPHLLVAGATGGGKSVFLNQMLCTLLQRNTPKQLEIVLIDLKGGLEFWPYHEIPHLRRPVVVEPTDVPDALQEVMNEKTRRFSLFRKAGVRDIKGWNATRANKLPYVMVIFDEIANLMLVPKLKAQVQALVQDLTAQGRALGLHMVLCTQIPNKDVLTTIIRGNIVSKVAFNTDSTGSMVILGNTRAAEIPPGGRMIYRKSNAMTECQAPYIDTKQIEAVIESIQQPQEAERHEITADDLFRRSLDNYRGKFTLRAIYDEFGGDVTQPFVREVAKSYEYDFDERGPIIELDGQRYVLGQVAMRGGYGRRLVPIQEPPETQEALQALSESAYSDD